MTTAKSRPTSVRDVATASWERRRAAAWSDYLRVLNELERAAYEHGEQNAWEQLQRRLRRNDELLDAAAATTATI
ncbi:MAG: hypothetical protein H7287_07360 [Thermoleophilia bacterium]|nr:hypothetical protein [Thermoleophilia bacterium]